VIFRVKYTLLYKNWLKQGFKKLKFANLFFGKKHRKLANWRNFAPKVSPDYGNGDDNDNYNEMIHNIFFEDSWLCQRLHTIAQADKLKI
jgi:hypothetical protein